MTARTTITGLKIDVKCCRNGIILSGCEIGRFLPADKGITPTIKDIHKCYSRFNRQKMCCLKTCFYYYYCDWLLQKQTLPDSERRKLSVNEAFKRSKCPHYQWRRHYCEYHNIITNRVICSLCCQINVEQVRQTAVQVEKGEQPCK